jgi:enoyl-CoA hydratase/carnithine racemase
MAYAELVVSRPADHVALITLSRPERLNALTDRMFAELHDSLADLGADKSVRALVITGAGRGFCAGLDLDEAARLPALSAADFFIAQERWAASIAEVCRTPQPVIAAVNGAAAGAGLSLAAACDIRLAAPTARFNAAFVRIGLSGGDCGSSWTLPRIVGLGRAAEILYSGRFVEADEAARIGLVNRVVDGDALVAEAVALASAIAANSPFGVRMTKSLLHANVDAGSLQAALEVENRSQVLAAQSHDMVEALEAFRAKRAPVFQFR